MTDSETDLSERIKLGDQQALVDFIELKRLPLLAFIQRSLSDAMRRKVEPDDILQEVSLSAVNSLDDVELGERDPFSWLCHLGERRIIDAHRRHFGAQKRSGDKEVGLHSPGGATGQRGFIDVLVASMTSPSQAFSRGQREFHLLEALESLPQESRDALRLRYVDGLPSKRIAEQLGKSDAATRVLLSRSLRKLQDILGENSLFQSFQSGS